MPDLEELLHSAFRGVAEIRLSANFQVNEGSGAEGESVINGSPAAIVFLLFKTMSIIPDFADSVTMAAKMYKDRPELVEKFKDRK